MSGSYSYHAFGLNIASEIELPHWGGSCGPTDVAIVWGPVPTALPDATCLMGVCWARPDVCLLNYPGVGRILIESGRRITAALDDGETLPRLCMLIAVTGMTAALYQRGQICLHASAVVVGGSAILCMGPSGAGKSTLAAALLQRGAGFISDDVSVLRATEEGAFEVTQSYPSIRLCADSYRELDLPEEGGSREPLDDKHRVRPSVSPDAKTAIVTRLCLLEVAPAAAPWSEPVRGIERALLIQRNLFRPRLARVVGDSKRLLDLSVRMAERLDFRRIVRPPGEFQLERLCALASA